MRAVLDVLLYFVICVTVALPLRLFTAVPSEVFRKILHCILLGSLAVWVTAFSDWRASAASALIFAVAVYPLLALAERIRGYSQLLTERKQGELKASLLVVFVMYAIVAAVCWGWLGDRMLALASIYAWGFGDAAAALVGRYFGRHKLNWRPINGRKSAEGTLAMFLVSFVSVLVILGFRGGLPIYGLVITAAATAAVSAAVELYTPNGMDTITCPLGAMAVILPLVNLFGGAL